MLARQVPCLPAPLGFDLEPFLGLRYPASDIPAQARALYEKNWIRLISDVDYAPVPPRSSVPSKTTCSSCCT